MNTWVRTGLAIITAGSISLALAACGSKEGDTIQAGVKGQVASTQPFDGMWILVSPKDEYSDLIATIKGQKLALITINSGDNDENGYDKKYCENLKTASKEYEGIEARDSERDDNAPYWVGGVAEIDSDFTMATFTGWGGSAGAKKAVPIVLSGGTMQISELDSSDTLVFSKTDQTDAKVLLTNTCGEVPQLG